jgi:type IV pilus assembly protein PilA
MLRKLRERINQEKGFTLIELLVVILIIGILAAIALPAFLGQQEKGQDSEAKSNARNLVSQMDSCYANTQDYGQCLPQANGTVGGDATGLDIGGNGGQVTATANGAAGFEVTATSKATDGGAHVFRIRRVNGGAIERSCTPANKGGCKTGAYPNGW